MLWTMTAVVSALWLGRAHSEEKNTPRRQTCTGELTRVEGTTLTVTRRGDSGEKSDTFTLDTTTRVLIETDQDETIKTNEGDRTRPKRAEAKLADLKTGQRVSVTYTTDNKAVEVVGLRPLKPRKKEGDG
jgi:hypothetical protein